jgi:predicted regulator of Ras-like GTPase activity (Roadblock/LC7/MglB family)
MQELLEQLRGVMGVSGVMILDRLERLAWTLIPTHLENENIRELEKKVRDLVDLQVGHSTFRVRFSSGWLVINATNEFILVILTREDVKLELLNLVIKASITRLRHFEGSCVEPEPTIEFQPQMGCLLLDAINCVGKHFRMIVGLSDCVSLLRKAKDDLLPAFPALKHFSVDNNGSVSLIRGSERHLDRTVVDSVARWCFRLKEMVNAKISVVGFDIREVTADVEVELTPIGFYWSYQRVASKVTHTS